MTIEQLCINTLRTLAIDAVEQAQSGHPGTAMGAAPVAYCLWQHFLRYDPNDTEWPNRDRFVLSSGHASMLLYGLLHLGEVKASNSRADNPAGLAVTIDDIKQFRQLGSRCTGHPEHGWTDGVETTTGPLGQGIATSVGMAIAERWQASTYNRPGFDLFKYKVYALCGDGDMMEGISSEAASLAGHLKLANLCWIYDANKITIEGSTSLAFTENLQSRFTSYGWNVIRVADANCLEQLCAEFNNFLENSDRPTLIIVPSSIGFGSPHKQDCCEAHGEPLGTEEARLTKQCYGWDQDAKFYIPDGVIEHFRAHFGHRGKMHRAEWDALFAAYRIEFPQLALEIDCMQRRDLPADWDRNLPKFPADAKGMATREASEQVLNAIARNIPWLVGGAADLAPSTRTRLNPVLAGDFQATGITGDYSGRNIHFGVREHAMCAISNGLSLSKLRPFTGSFLVFSDYARGALRLAAMMKIPVITIWTHDSFLMGEDGPTHQPVEQLASLRAMPGMRVLRPADANELIEAWRVIMMNNAQPVCLILSRQALATLDRTRYASASGLAMGAYVLADDPEQHPDVLLLATGSEVNLCIAAYEQLKEEGIRARVISMPCWDLFEAQSQEYRDSVLPPQIMARVTVEAASGFGWERYAGPTGCIISLSHFGLSAPMHVLQQEFGFETGHIIAAVREQLLRHA
jgi:transketolase